MAKKDNMKAKDDNAKEKEVTTKDAVKKNEKPREEEIVYQSVDMDSIETLERTCRTEEDNFETFKLISLEAATSAGRKVTKAMYQEVTDGSVIKKLSIEKFSAARKAAAEFEGDAFILTVRTKVLVFR